MEDMVFLIVIADLYLGTKCETSGISGNDSIKDLQDGSFPVPLFPIRATRSPRFISKWISVNKVCPGNALESPPL